MYKEKKEKENVGCVKMKYISQKNKRERKERDFDCLTFFIV